MLPIQSKRLFEIAKAEVEKIKDRSLIGEADPININLKQMRKRLPLLLILLPF